MLKNVRLIIAQLETLGWNDVSEADVLRAKRRLEEDSSAFRVQISSQPFISEDEKEYYPFLYVCVSGGTRIFYLGVK